MTNKELPSISLVMIAKNEAEIIARAIESARPFCREIIVADTGSTDGTQDICRKAGAVVYSFPWSGSFSEARNFALGFVRTEWVLALDADEELDSESFAAHLHALADEKCGGVRVWIHNSLSSSGHESTSKHSYTRLFRSRKEIRYSGRIHEQIAESIAAAGYEIADSQIIIKHHGYETNDPAKAKRNLRLLIEDLADSPGDPFILYHIAETEFALGQYPEAMQNFQKIHLSAGLSEAQREMSNLRIAQMLLRQDEAAKMLDILSFVSEDTEREGFRKYLLAIACLILQDYSQAKAMINAQETASSTLVDQTNRVKLADALSVI